MTKETGKAIRYRAFSIRNFRKIPQIENLSEEEKRNIEVVGNVLPFKVNNYVIDELIDWNNYKTDPIFHLTFPQKGMLEAKDFQYMSETMEKTSDRDTLRRVADEIRQKLNPHPAAQMEMNMPEFEG